MSCPCGNGCGGMCQGCGQLPAKCRCALRPGPKPGCHHKEPRAFVAPCSDCDPCCPRKSMVKICSFVVPTLEEGRVFRDSFIFNQEDDAVYYINDDGTELPFGARPMFIEGFDPTKRVIPRQTVFDFSKNKGYVYDATGAYKIFDLRDPE